MLNKINKYAVNVLAGLALLAGLATATVGAASLDEIRDRGSIRIAIADEEPYGYLDEDGEATGPGPDVARHVLNELGIDEIEWIVTDFGDLISGLQEGRFDMAAAEMAILPERCEKIIYSEPNTTYGEGLLVKTGNPRGIRGYDDFRLHNDLRVAVMGGANQIDFLKETGVSEDSIVTIERNREAIEAIASGNADAYAATSLTVNGLARDSDEVEAARNFVDPVIDGREIRSWGGFAFNRESADLRDAFNEVLVPYKYTDDWEDTLTRHGFSKLDVLNSFKYDTARLCRME